MVPLAMLLAVLWLPLGWLAWSLLGGAADPDHGCRGPTGRVTQPRVAGAGLSTGPTPGRLAAALVLVPSAFVAGEALRSWEGLGGPWGLLGASQWNAPALLSVAALGGVWGLSFLLVAVNVAVAVAAGPRVPAPTRAAAAAAAVALPLAALGFWALRPAPAPAGTARVAYVEPGVVGPVEERFRASERLTGALPAGARPDLVVWGERASAATRRPTPATWPGWPRPPGPPAGRCWSTSTPSGNPAAASTRAPCWSARPGCSAATTRCGWCRSGVRAAAAAVRLGDPADRRRRRRPPPRRPPGRPRGRGPVGRPAGLLRVGLPRPGQEPGRRRGRPGGGADRRHHLPAELGPGPARQPVGGAGGGVGPPGGPGRPQRDLGRLRRPRPPAGLGAGEAGARPWPSSPCRPSGPPYVRTGDVVPAACGVALVVAAVVAARRRGLSRGGSGRRTGSTPRSTPARPRR